MAAANASARGQRAAILASPLHELTGFYLAVDCLAPRCNGERTFAVAELATFYGRGYHGGAGPAPNAVFWPLWRPRGGGLAGHRTDPQRTRQTPTRAALGAGGTRIAILPRILPWYGSIRRCRPQLPVGALFMDASPTCVQHPERLTDTEAASRF
jgi:hypothetical protein